MKAGNKCGWPRRVVDHTPPVAAALLWSAFADVEGFYVCIWKRLTIKSDELSQFIITRE